MPVYALTEDPTLFPSPAEADPEGLLAVGGDLCLERLVHAYARGIFPWYSDDSPILWWSPDPRPLIAPDTLHIGRRLARQLRAAPFRITFDHAFEQVVAACARTPRPGEQGTWLTDDMRRAYADMYRAGFAHSVEAWLPLEDADDVPVSREEGRDVREEGAGRIGAEDAHAGWRLVGGLYGVSLGCAFFGESMFHREPDASKVAFAHLSRAVFAWGYHFIDCQQQTPHMARFGAEPMPRVDFLGRLAEAVLERPAPGAWRDFSFSSSI